MTTVAHQMAQAVTAPARLMAASGRLMAASGRLMAASGRLMAASGRLIAVVALLCASACSSPSPTSQPSPAPAQSARTATLSELAGDVRARQAVAETFVPAVLGLVLGIGDQMRTGEDSRARLDYSDGSIFRMDETSELTILPVDAADPAAARRFQLSIGRLWITLFGGSSEIETPVGVAAVRGSFAVVIYRPGQLDDPADDMLIVDCIEGSCQVRSETVDEALGNLQRVIITRTGPPVRQTLTSDDVLDFIRNNPYAAEALVATLAAAPPTSTPTTVPSTAAASDTLTPAPAPTDTSTPVSPSPTVPTLIPTPVPPPAASVTILGSHVVRPGESLFCIGRAYGVLPTAIAQVNGLPAPYNLAVGQLLSIPAVQWIAMTPGPVCVRQFASPYPGYVPPPPVTPIPVTPSLVPTPITPVPITVTPTPSATPSVTPILDRTGPVINSSSANPPSVVSPYYCAVQFTADISDPSGVLFAQVVWTSAQFTTGSYPMAPAQGQWVATFTPHVLAGSSTSWYILTSDTVGNIASGGGGTITNASTYGDCGTPGRLPTPTATP